MSKETLQALICRYLIAQGYREIKSHSAKYRQFERPYSAKRGPYLFVGKAGAVRYGQTVSDSHSLSSHYKRLADQWVANNGAS